MATGIELELGPAINRIERTMAQHADRIIGAQGQSERRILDGIGASEGRLHDNINRGVNHLDGRIASAGGYRPAYIYPPMAGIAATSRGAYLMAEHGGGGHGGGLGFLGTVGAVALGILAAVLLIGLLRLAAAGAVSATSVNTAAEAPIKDKGGTKNCPIWILKGKNADGVPEYRPDFNC